MTEFWESNFNDKQTIWGFEPADSAIDLAKKHYRDNIKVFHGSVNTMLNYTFMTQIP